MEHGLGWLLVTTVAAATAVLGKRVSGLSGWGGWSRNTGKRAVQEQLGRGRVNGSEGRETVQISRAVAGAKETMEKELGTGVREDAWGPQLTHILP